MSVSHSQRELKPGKHLLENWLKNKSTGSVDYCGKLKCLKVAFSRPLITPAPAGGSRL